MLENNNSSASVFCLLQSSFLTPYFIKTYIGMKLNISVQIIHLAKQNRTVFNLILNLKFRI